MITELFSMLSSIDVSGKGAKQKFSVNLNRNHIRSISAYSSNSIFYFPTVTSDQVTPEEMAMISRVLEKSYATFVVTCISLMPFHRIRSDDQASIEAYLSQFHQNMGINAGSGPVVNKMLGLVSTIEESANGENDDLAALQNFLLECWEKSKKNCSNYINIVSETISLNDMYSKDHIDPMTRLLQEQYFENMKELDTWGFLGEATADMFDTGDDDLELMSDEEIIRRVTGVDISDGDDDDLENQYPEIDALLSEGNVKSAIDSIMFSLESVTENKILSCSSLTKLTSLESKLNKLKHKYAKYLTRYKRKHKENEKNGTSGKLSIRFNGATISNPKAFMKQYGAYIKIINKRLKLVDKRRAELRKRKGLPDPAEDRKLEESGIPVLSDIDLRTIDHCVTRIDESLNAPDSEIFIIDEATTDELLAQIADLEQRNANLADALTKKQTLVTQSENDRRRAENISKHSQVEAKKQKLRYQQEQRRVGELQSQLKSGQVTEKELRTTLRNLEKKNASLEKDIEKMRIKGPYDPRSEVNTDGAYWDSTRPMSGLNIGRAAQRNGYTGHKTFDKEIFTDMDMKKSNEAIPTYTKASIGFIVDETEQVVTRDVLVGIKVHLRKVPAIDLINDLYNCIINKRKFLRFVKFISGEEKSLADLLFGFKELKIDALNSRTGGARQWGAAFRRRKRWSKMSVPYLMKEYTPNGTVVLTMNEVQYIKDEYGLDIMTQDHVNMIMDASFLLGFVILDQANEMCYITYDGHGGDFQQYTYSMLERESSSASREVMQLYRAISR